MRYISFLIIFLLCVSSAELGAQERIAYRVEVIVLRLVQSDFPADPNIELRDYTDALDLAKLKLERQDWTAAWTDMHWIDAGRVRIIPPLTPEASQFIVSEGITYIPEPSDQMSDVWRNLRLSAEYRPEIYLSWVQRAEGTFPNLRLHNEEVIRIDDDFSDQRIFIPPTDPEKPAFPQQIYQYDFATGTLELAPLTAPRQHYSVDGEVVMRRSRFLHLELDIEYRIPTPATLSGMSGPPLLLVHQGYQSYPLKQSRQIRTGRMEYFDSPVLGALVWVTAIEKPEEDAR